MQEKSEIAARSGKFGTTRLSPAELFQTPVFEKHKMPALDYLPPEDKEQFFEFVREVANSNTKEVMDAVKFGETLRQFSKSVAATLDGFLSFITAFGTLVSLLVLYSYGDILVHYAIGTAPDSLSGSGINCKIDRDNDILSCTLNARDGHTYKQYSCTDHTNSTGNTLSFICSR